MNQILLIDRNYMALSIISWKKAVKLLVKEKAEAASEVIGMKIQTNGKILYLPSIVRLLKLIPWKSYQNRSKFSRRNLMIRDSFTCQYCGIKLGKMGTIDHVVPKSRGGITSYLNCVACCPECNAKKKNKLPEEVGIMLLSKPKKPNFLILYTFGIDFLPDEWMPYIIGK